MISAETVGLVGLGITILLAQRTQNNSLAKRLEEGTSERLKAVEDHQAVTDDHISKIDNRVVAIEAVCKLRHEPRPGPSYQGI